jgi:hypothetical protein
MTEATAPLAPRNWIAVASAEHARRGRDEMQPGFMQVGHGKLSGLKRLRAGDRVAYYAPTTVFGVKDGLQRFVSIGTVLPGEPYAFDMGGGFVPWRRDVAYLPAQEASILPLLDELDFIENRQRWGYKFRFGLFQIGAADMQRIARAMKIEANLISF